MIYDTDKFYGNSLTESDAKKNRKLFILYVKKKVIGGATVIYVVVKISTGRNQIGDQGQSQTLAVTTKPVIERVVSNPYVSIFDEYRPSGLYMNNFERPSLISQHYSLYDSQEVINELRAGDSRWTQAAWLLITIWMLQQQGAGFQPVRQVPPPPHLESARNLLFGKPKPDQFSCRRLSMFDSQQFENQEKFVMSKQEALNLLDKTYTGSKKNSETEKISDWQMAKKVYHLNGLGVNPEEYGMSKDEVNAIRKDGLVKHTMKGGKLPPVELIYEGQNQIEEICRNETTVRKENGVFGKVKKPSNFYYNRYTQHIIYFDKITGDLIVGEKFRQPYFNKALINNNISILDNNKKN